MTRVQVTDVVGWLFGKDTSDTMRDVAATVCRDHCTMLEISRKES